MNRAKVEDTKEFTSLVRLGLAFKGKKFDDFILIEEKEGHRRILNLEQAEELFAEINFKSNGEKRRFFNQIGFHN